MTIYEAERICRSYFKMVNPTEEEEFVYVEALNFLIEETQS